MPSSLMLALAFHLGDAHAAEDPCEHAKLEEDKFGGGTNVVYVVATTAKGVSMDLTVTSGVTEMHVFVGEAGDIDGIVPAGTTVPFSFGGSVVNLATVRAGQRVSQIDPGLNRVVTVTPFTFTLTRDQVQMMSRTTLAAIRFPLQGGPFDYTPNKGFQEKLVEASACALLHSKDPTAP
jgi:hypothetical protein